jgi:hypothetical protein
MTSGATEKLILPDHQTSQSRRAVSYCEDANRARSNSMTVDAQTWITAFAETLGLTPPSQAEIEKLLAMAGVAAHASERISAPVSCWLAARAGKSAEEALAAAETLASSLRS